MGRIQTPQINFSLIDTNYARKEYALKVRVKFGLIGHLVLYEVIGWINEGKGCYAEYTEDTAATFAMTRLGALDYAAKVDEIFHFMIEIGFFDKAAFLADRILTSEGIVRRWMAAKRRPESYDFPPSVKGIILSIREEKPAANGQENGGSDEENENAENQADPGLSATIPQNAPKNTENAPKSTETKLLSRQGEERRGEEYKYKQTNKQTNREVGTIEDAKKSPRWDEIRLRIVRTIYEPGLSSDLTDAITAAAVFRWIKVPQLDAWIRKARDELEVSRRTDQRRGKTRIWATLRPWIEEVYRTYGITLPRCDPRKKEPPPKPLNAPDDDEQAKRAASSAVFPK